MTPCIKLPRSALSDDLWRNPYAARLLFYLLAKADENGEYKVSLKDLHRDLGLSKKQYHAGLEVLKGASIAVPKGSAKTASISLCGIDSKRISKDPKKDPKAAPKTDPIATAKNAPPAHPEAAATPGFVSPEYAVTWRRFLAYRKEIKKPYKSEASERIAYNKMVEMANNDPAAAKDMVERTILGQWQGLFPKNSNGTKPVTNPSLSAQTDRYSELERAAETVLRNAPYFDTPQND